MFEERAGDVVELVRILSEMRVFELNNIDAVEQRLALDEPCRGSPGLAEFAHGVGKEWNRGADARSAVRQGISLDGW